MTEIEAVAKDRELTITYQGRTFDLLAYPTDIGVWEATAHEQGDTSPAKPAADWGAPGLYRDPLTALSILTDAILRRVDDTPEGHFIETLRTFQAEVEATRRSARIKDGLAKKQEKSDG
jgi:hypothetical protein